MREVVAALPRAERATVKGEAFARLTPRTVSHVGGRIELRSLRAIPDGVEVLLRAWDARDRPIGFGDGSVEIERVRVINPPILVPDVAGPVDLSWTDEAGQVHVRRFREDLDAALVEVLAHTIRVTPRGQAPISPGRVGRTVSTFYAGGGDGWVEVTNFTWDGAHDATAGDGADATTNPFRVMSFLSGAGAFQIRRAFIPIDTSALPDTDVISAATFSLYVASLTGNGDNDGDDFFVPVGPTSQADPTTLGTADYDTCGAVDSPSELSDDRKDYSSHTLNAYADWPLNAAGLAAISATGYSLFGLREGHDVIDSAYAGSLNSGNQIRYASSEATGTTQDPVLVVTHAAGGGGSTPIPSMRLIRSRTSKRLRRAA